ncbi:sialate O-acetylesterase [Sphingobacterium sp. SGG-5]|uniref:sialate O-acetylesterase n=1 Tax=Sphingobacterium sp. SGG-5 TaxID=2710881 RepID=UPI0013EDCA27|nr:sialate O-acetylesterase [Sphingobacterium sp. SGG-5]NGM61276.1 sialate O-acetylesterase [Sphingobacterium sp. SGG-5]
MRKIFFLSLVMFCCGLHAAKASLVLPRVFTDGMVLQQKSEVKIWGKGSPKEKVILQTSWNGKSYGTSVGVDSLWKITVSTPEASFTKYEVTLVGEREKIVLKDVLIGEVWLCSGQSNMHMPMKGYFNQPVSGSLADIVASENDYLRFFTVKQNSSLVPLFHCDGVWENASMETTADFSATAYYFGRLLQKTLNVPVGLIHASWGGSKIEAWMSKKALADFPEIRIPTEEPNRRVAPLRATVMYNGMLHPIAGYTIKGVIWYQGESSQRDYKKYPALFKAMHQDWIEKWNVQTDFPIYFCQITPYDHYTFKLAHFMREAQLKIAQNQPNTAMAVLMDAGEKDILHCADKKTPGERLAYIALANLYGFNTLSYRSPEFKSLNQIDEKLIVRFNYAKDGLNTFGRELNNFKIAGEDRVFYPAKAEIVLNSVELSSPEVSHPIAVRYAFENYAESTLFGINGQPVSSFRSDDWDDIP